MRKIFLLIFLIVVVGVFVFEYKTGENKVETNVPGNKQTNATTTNSTTTSPTSDIKVTTNIQDGQIITSPLKIVGQARGNWFFEASFPVVVVDWDGKIIGTGHAQATGDWMTTSMVPFTADINFTVPKNSPKWNGAIILKKDNPSGDPARDESIEIPVMFK
jgi:hypothetical protein